MKLEPGSIQTELRLVSEKLTLRELCTEAEEKYKSNGALLQEKICGGYGPVFEKCWTVGAELDITLILTNEMDSTYDRYVPRLILKSHSAVPLESETERESSLSDIPHRAQSSNYYASHASEEVYEMG